MRAARMVHWAVERERERATVRPIHRSVGTYTYRFLSTVSGSVECCAHNATIYKQKAAETHIVFRAGRAAPPPDIATLVRLYIL